MMVKIRLTSCWQISFRKSTDLAVLTVHRTIVIFYALCYSYSHDLTQLASYCVKLEIMVGNYIITSLFAELDQTIQLAIASQDIAFCQVRKNLNTLSTCHDQLLANLYLSDLFEPISNLYIIFIIQQAEQHQMKPS